ncbi:MAG: aminotransferase class I/II-fold pyridoxal phosphate-dependent enzyme [Bacteroidia bacterium]
MLLEKKDLSFKDFEKIKGSDIYSRAFMHSEFLNVMNQNQHLNYRLEIESACGPVVYLKGNNYIKNGEYVNLVSNDYLGLTQHPKVIDATIESIKKYGTGSGASPLIGGMYNYHTELEMEINKFFNKKISSSIIYSTGYTANSSTLSCLLTEDDIAIMDMNVHASVFEGVKCTTKKRFKHNDIDDLERILKNTRNNYETKLVVVDGVYSQDGDLSKLREIVEVVKKYGAMIMVDDAHGIGIIGETGRGVLELFNLIDEVDIITGTFSKSLGNIGGFVLASPNIISYLHYQSRQYAFSVSPTPAISGVTQAIKLISEEPELRNKLWFNINYFKAGLNSLNFNIGDTGSAIIPVKISDVKKTSEMSKMLLGLGIYTNAIMYPAVSRKDSRIRMSVMASHSKEHLDKALNAFELIKKRLLI